MAAGYMDGRDQVRRPRTQETIGGFRSGRDPMPDPTVSVRIKELSQFPGDQVFTAGATALEVLLTTDAAYPYTLLRNIRGFRFVDISGAVYADVNGGGGRKVFEKDAYDFVHVTSIRLMIPALGSITIQQWAE